MFYSNQSSSYVDCSYVELCFAYISYILAYSNNIKLIGITAMLRWQYTCKNYNNLVFIFYLYYYRYLIRCIFVYVEYNFTLTFFKSYLQLINIFKVRHIWHQFQDLLGISNSKTFWVLSNDFLNRGLRCKRSLYKEM